jgi:hypothetical protein
MACKRSGVRLPLAPPISFIEILSMARKEDIINYITDLAVKNILTKNEVVSAYDLGKKYSSTSTNFSSIISIAIAYIGGLLIFFGLAIYSYKYFAKNNDVIFWLIILGFGIIIHAVNLTLEYKEKALPPAIAFCYLLSYLLILLGTKGVLSYYRLEYGIILGFISLFLTYLISFLISKKNISLFYLIISTSFLFLSGGLITISALNLQPEFIFYTLAVIGLTQIGVGKLISITKRHILSPWLYIIGSSIFLGSIFYLYNFKFYDNQLWEVIIMVLIIAMIALGVMLGSKSLIIVSFIYFVSAASKISIKYLLINSLIRNPLDLSLVAVVVGLAIIIALVNYHILKTRFFV